MSFGDFLEVFVEVQELAEQLVVDPAVDDEAVREHDDDVTGVIGAFFHRDGSAARASRIDLEFVVGEEDHEQAAEAIEVEALGVWDDLLGFCGWIFRQLSKRVGVQVAFVVEEGQLCVRMLED